MLKSQNFTYFVEAVRRLCHNRHSEAAGTQVTTVSHSESFAARRKGAVPRQTFMVRLRDITIRARLRALVTISTVGFAAMLGLSVWVLHQYRIEGPVYTDLQRVREVVTDMEPAVLTITRPQLIVEGLVGTTDPPRIARRLDDLKALENEYQARYDFWTKAALDPEIKDEIAKCNKPVEEYFRLIDSELAPALRQNQTDQAKKLFDRAAQAVLRDLSGDVQEGHAAHSRYREQDAERRQPKRRSSGCRGWSC